ncbi:hypothetical protein TNCT_647381 [Trichonephila clavata]|uniref:DUF5641 domain-containing protein n=1 Tax=Trichonephila clavata TaxID=2740835 RepID=A0A8X6LS26_TRICU|nr:hypothetical protein TNCT_647381 [Trichonephila clavata]
MTGDSPRDRFVPFRSFERIGLDYTGPLITKPNLRGSKDPNIKPLNWYMGRILEVFPGNYGLVRVVEMKTSSGILRRAIQKIVPLPIPDDPAFYPA